MIQNIVTVLIGIIAFAYAIKIILRQFSKSEINTKCENCPVPELIKNNKGK